MKTNNISRIAVVVGLVCSALVSGCASVAVTDDSIEKNTAFALGIDRGTFTISNRADEGVKTTYSVATNAGRKYNCYVTGTVSVVGRVVSDAVCNEIAKPGKQVGGSGASCNALNKAAGKCN